MPVYIYGICHADTDVPDCGGLDERPLRSVAAAGLAALVSDHGESIPLPSEQELWQHERVVECLMTDDDVLPARFGSVLPSESAVGDFLRERSTELESALHAVAGALELGVRARPVHVADVARVPSDGLHGAAYLRSRVATQQRTRELARDLDAALRGLARDARVRVVTTPSASVKAAYLVGRSGIESFRAKVDELADELDDAVIACTGPWPPYSFTGIGAEHA
jgi:hypothetical protein